ncbi:hypothetical protein [Bacillus mycoides]|uniref:hypothetical protein n=1 Tax=Bacillus mycoides TaxID=1405 RepID=UPI0024AD44C7|nr:hypothetical protein [Bacillus mycoides]MDI6535162.1 hypothetical protein [Bacillus mycoides]
MKTPADVIRRYGQGLGLGYHAYLAYKMGSSDLPLLITSLRQAGAHKTADKYEEQWIKGKLRYERKVSN